MATKIAINRRVKEILRLLDHTPLPAHLILEGSQTFGSPEESDTGFGTVRRVRQRMLDLVRAKLVTLHEFTLAGRGTMNFYHLAPDGYRVLYHDDPPPEHRRFFRPAANLNWEHTYANARVIVKTLVAAHRAGIRVNSLRREGELTLTARNRSVQPDHFFQLAASGSVFNMLFEIDRQSETLDGHRVKAWRQRILTYQAYQEKLLAHHRKERLRRLRVIFLTISMQHAYNFLALARDLAANPRRLLFYASTIDTYLSEERALTQPILLDHRGHFQSLVNLHSSSQFQRTPVILPRQVLEPPLPL